MFSCLNNQSHLEVEEDEGEEEEAEEAFKNLQLVLQHTQT